MDGFFARFLRQHETSASTPRPAQGSRTSHTPDRLDDPSPVTPKEPPSHDTHVFEPQRSRRTVAGGTYRRLSLPDVAEQISPEHVGRSGPASFSVVPRSPPQRSAAHSSAAVDLPSPSPAQARRQRAQRRSLLDQKRLARRTKGQLALPTVAVESAELLTCSTRALRTREAAQRSRTQTKLRIANLEQENARIRQQIDKRARQVKELQRIVHSPGTDQGDGDCPTTLG